MAMMVAVDMQNVSNKIVDPRIKTAHIGNNVELKKSGKPNKGGVIPDLKSGFQEQKSTRSGKGCGGVELRCGWDGGYKPAGCLSGKEIQSSINRPFINLHGTYRDQSLTLDAMRQAGVPAEVLEIFELANQLGAAGRPGAGNSTVSAEELLKVESCLGRDQLDALEAAWALMELGDVDGVHGSQGLLPLDELVIDRSIRPRERDLAHVAVSIESLPKSARKDATWARRVSTGQEDGVITLRDLKAAAEATDKTTPAQRKKYDQNGGVLFECVRQLAASKDLVPPRAQLELPPLDKTLKQIVDADCIEIFQKTSTEAGGEVKLPSEWATFVPHQRARGRGCLPPPHLSDFDFNIERQHSLDVDIPAGHQVIIAPECGHEGQTLVYDGSAKVDDLAAGTYRASVMHEGKIVSEAVFEMCSDVGTDTKDLSAYYGHDLVTADGDLGVEGNWTAFNITDCGGRPFSDLLDLKHTVTPGRYEDTLDWRGYNKQVDFKLDSLSDETLHITVGEKSLQMIPARRPTNAKIVGFELPEMFYQVRLTDSFPGSMRFPATLIVNPETQQLHLVGDMENSCHTSTGWRINRKLEHLATVDLSKARIA